MERPAAARAQAAGGEARVKCLLVDDRVENLIALSALLGRDDIELLQARSGTEALELLLVHDVALALVDVQMPEMDGFQLAELMRGTERTRHVPIIFVTAGQRDQHGLFKGYGSGAVDFLYKPIDPYILGSKVEVFLQMHRQKQQLAREMAERTETLRVNEMFTAMLGHDLRGPLAAILMSAQQLANRPDEVSKRIAARLTGSGKWMNRMIEDMLDLARARVGEGIPLARRDIDLGALVERAVGERRAAQPDRTIELTQRGDLTGCWDEDRLMQVASNLIGNALHHGNPALPVEIGIDGGAADTVRFEVSNGGAIAPEVLPHIFDPFRGGQRRSNRSEGLGLGLYIVKQIVEAHAGSVHVDTGAGDRTCLQVRLPRRPAAMP
ncbi:MAG: hybrid sensor histidine kinase/response regulator [Proteobacteria bacterium]|nr:hybrid sensor histidine kinase/response regulator [Pseudomonadota bacterium]